MIHEIVPPEPKSGKTTGEKVAEVDALLSIVPDLGAVRACRRIGIPKETYYWHKRKQKGPAIPDTDRGANDHTPPNGASSPPGEHTLGHDLDPKGA